MSEFHASAKTSYVKLSGGFSELPDLLLSLKEIVHEYLLPWFTVILQLWGPKYIIFGTDWPVCKIGGGPNAVNRWIQVVDYLLDTVQLSDSEKDDIYYGNALRAYNLQVTDE